MDFLTAIKKGVAEVRANHSCEVTKHCKVLCRELKQKGYPILVKDVELLIAEHRRQSIINDKRYRTRVVTKQPSLQCRRYNWVRDIAYKKIQDNYFLQSLSVDLVPVPFLNIEMSKRWAGHVQYPTYDYQFTVHVDPHWKTTVQDRKLSMINNCFVTHVKNMFKVNGITFYEVSYLTKKLVNVVKLHNGVVVEDEKGNKCICSNAKDFNLQTNKIGIKLDKKIKTLLKDMQESIGVAKVLSSDTEAFDLYGTLKEIL